MEKKNIKVIILPGWFQKTTDNWYPWLQSKLNAVNISCEVADLPTRNTEAPQMEEMVKYLNNNYLIDENTSFVGHSLGSVLALRIAERFKIGLLFLTSAWDFNDLTQEHASFWVKMTDHKTIISNTHKIHLIYTNNDPYISQFQTEEMTKRLNAQGHFIQNGGRFITESGFNEFPLLYEIILKALK